MSDLSSLLVATAMPKMVGRASACWDEWFAPGGVRDALADWLEECGDDRADKVRECVADGGLLVTRHITEPAVRVDVKGKAEVSLSWAFPGKAMFEHDWHLLEDGHFESAKPLDELAVSVCVSYRPWTDGHVKLSFATVETLAGYPVFVAGDTMRAEDVRRFCREKVLLMFGDEAMTFPCPACDGGKSPPGLGVTVASDSEVSAAGGRGSDWCFLCGWQRELRRTCAELTRKPSYKVVVAPGESFTLHEHLKKCAYALMNTGRRPLSVAWGEGGPLVAPMGCEVVR